MHRRNDKTTRTLGSAKEERKRDGNEREQEFDLSTGLRRFRQSVFKVPKHRTSPIPFPPVVHGVLQELADVSTAGNAARSSNVVARWSRGKLMLRAVPMSGS